MSKALLRGNAQTFRELCDRAYGKVPSKMEVTGKDAGPVEYRHMSDADLDARIRQLQNELGLVPIWEWPRVFGHRSPGNHRARWIRRAPRSPIANRLQSWAALNLDGAMP